MTADDRLARIERVDLREIWPNEAVDFTPWLADNLSQLGAALGLDLEFQEKEASVGGYSLDVLARDIGSDGEVVIENQLGTTNHRHLGQLLTYAAGFDAKVAVWIASKFREEHREALDLLNRRTGEDTQFFGVEVELWKIDGSRPAPSLKLVAYPNEWRKQGAGGAQGAQRVSDRGERYRAFFQPLVAVLRDKHGFTNRRQVGTRSWSSFSAGVSGGGVTYNASFAQGGRARVQVYIDNGDVEWNEELFDRLEEGKEEIESKIEGEFEWQRLDNRRACRISAVRPGSIDEDEETLKEIRSWMVDRLLKFKEVFGPRLDELAR